MFMASRQSIDAIDPGRIEPALETGSLAAKNFAFR